MNKPAGKASLLAAAFIGMVPIAATAFDRLPGATMRAVPIAVGGRLLVVGIPDGMAAKPLPAGLKIRRENKEAALQLGARYRVGGW